MEKIFKGGSYKGERALFMLKDSSLDGVTFYDGESPLKESANLKLNNCIFKWKYPLWYANNIELNNSYISITARSGIWYTKNLVVNKTIIDAPKTFRKASFVTLNDVTMNNAQETLWWSDNIKLNNVTAKGDYFMMKVDNAEINDLKLDGNYFLDGAKNIVIKNSILNSKDSFWNTENVTVIDCKIVGEYLGWNSKNLTFINCEISSLQALCYIQGLRMVNCKLTDSTLTLEYCENLDVEIIDEIQSIKNPTSGIIKAKAIKELIIDENTRDLNKETKIEIIK